MYKKIIWNDIKSSKFISITILLFILFNSFLLSISGIIFVNLNSSINQLLEVAKTPHYLQMHIGDFNKSRMDDFAKNNDKISDYQVQVFLNVDSSDIYINGERFLNNSQDNGFVFQNKNFDYLLTLDNEIANPKSGENYVPLAYILSGEIHINDKIVVNGEEFNVVGPIRDSQMNSTLSSSKRFLINEGDFEKLKSIGSEEYLVEFLLKDVSTITEFEGEYASANLESNGPTITHSLFKLINAISDGIMIAVLFLISFLLIIISFLCINFTLNSKIEDEFREIGVMKAIGIRNSEIKKIYLGRYLAISIIGCILGFILSLVLMDFFLEPIYLNLGGGRGAGMSLIVGFLLSLFVFILSIGYVNRVLNVLKKFSPTQALRNEATIKRKIGKQGFKLQNQKLISSDVFLGVKRISTRKKLYITFILVLILSTFIMVLPRNIHSTISSKNFVSYMGIGKSDLLITIQESGDMKNTTSDILNALNVDKEVSDYTIKHGKKYEMKLDDGVMGRLQVVLGDQSKFIPKYVKGEFPTSDGEISISHLNAQELQKDIGDKITLIVDGMEKELLITGIYSDITNGGKTGHATFVDDEKESLWTSIPVTFNEGVNVTDKVEQYESKFQNAKITGIEENIDQVFGSTIKSISTVSYVGIMLAIFLVFLNTVLFVKMLVSKERRDIAILKTLGFSSKDIKFQYHIGSILLLIFGVLMGTILAVTLGQTLTSALLGAFGVADLQFSLNYVFVLILAPLTLAFFVLLASSLGVKSISKMKISDYIKE